MNMISRISLLSLSAAAMLTFQSCRNSAGGNKTDKNPPVNVGVETVKTSSMTDAVQIAGAVKAYEDVNISPEEGGVVKEWKAVKGDQVKKDDLIVVLKDEMIKAGFDAAEAQYKMAELNLERQKEVYDQQGISELQYKNLQYTRDAAKANADLMRARWERTQIKSPIDGVVDNTVPDEGEYAPPGVPIARVVNVSKFKIEAEIPEIYSGSVSVGTQALVSVDALRGVQLRGKVAFVGSTVSAVNRTLFVEIGLTEPGRALKPDMVVKVKLLRETKTNAILVSANVVQLVDRDRTIVYVEKNGRAEERRLKLGGRQGNLVEVLEGLKSGDRLIVSGYQKVVDGSPVVVTQ